MVRDFLDAVVVVLASIALVALVVLAFSGIEVFTDEGTEYVASVEFVTTQAGAPRFQRHKTNEDGIEVVVDAETGVAYLMTGDGTTALVERDGEPMTTAEVGDAD